MACPTLQEEIKGLQAEVQRPLSGQQAAVQAATAVSNEACQEVQHEREQAQQASLRSGPCRLSQVLRHGQVLCWQHKMGHKTCLLPNTLWPQISGWLIALFWAFYEDLVLPFSLPGRCLSAAAVPDIVRRAAALLDLTHMSVC